VVSNFSEEYLQSPNNNDIARLLALGESCGFPRMLGSIDCMHWKWKNCPIAWQGNFTGHIHEPTIILEAVALYDLWIWHALFGLPGSHNDINVLERSSVFTKLVEGRVPLVNYSINGNNYAMGYYLADGIYPPWSIFVKTIPSPQGPKKKKKKKKKEEVISLKNKRKQGRMWRVCSECFNHALQLFMDLHVFSKLKHLKTL
jgi:hypothetical protein